MLKKYAILLIYIFLVFFFTSSSVNSIKIEEQLKKLQNVVSVTPIKSSPQQKPFFTEKYEIVFQQPLDWNNPEKGSFNQLVTLGLHGLNKNTAVYLEGYNLQKNFLYKNKESIDEIPLLFDCNYIDIEHRFYGNSKPENLSDEDYTQWQNLTTFNQACDVHHIITELKKIFTNKWIIYGVSKGGYTTNLQSMYFPEDAQIYIPYVANCCNSLNDTRLYDYVYTKIGNTYYGSKKAAYYRNLILNFQIWCIQNKKELLPLLKKLNSENAKYRSFNNDDILFETTIAEFNVNIWQYETDFTPLEKFFKLEENTKTKKQRKLSKAVSFIKNASPESLFSYNSNLLPYYIQAYMELGNYQINFNYLKTALEQVDSPTPLSISSEENSNLYFKMMLSKKQIENLSYHSSTYEKLLNWSQNTTSHVLMIYGENDPWYSVRIPDATENPNIKIFVDHKYNHFSCINDFEESTRNEIIQIINSWLSEQ